VGLTAFCVLGKIILCKMRGKERWKCERRTKDSKTL